MPSRRAVSTAPGPECSVEREIAGSGPAPARGNCAITVPRPALSELGETWLRTALAVVGGMFATHANLSFFMPFLVLYLQEIGLTAGESAVWAGYIGFIQGLAFAVGAPFWGMLGDRIGRKPMAVRGIALSALGTLLVPFANSAPIVFLIIMGRGLLAGPGSAALALVSSVTPRRRLATVVGWIDAAQVLGSVIGLAAGGLLAAAIGIRETFLVGGGFGLLGALVVLLFARERFVRPPSLATPTGLSPLQRLAGILARARSTVNPTVLFACLLSGGFWMTNLGINYIIPLRVQEMTDPARVPLFTGLAASIFAATMFAGVVLAARLADRWGYRQVLFVGILGMVVLFLPQGFTGDLALFVAARALQGFCAGLINPLGRTLIALASDPADQGTVYGISGLFMGTGAAMGPLVFGSLFTPWLGVGPAIALMAVCLVPALLSLLRRSEINALAARG